MEIQPVNESGRLYFVVVVPETIVVHDGPPNSNAENYYVPTGLHQKCGIQMRILAHLAPRPPSPPMSPAITSFTPEPGLYGVLPESRI